jgi:hypothetical protein
VITNPPGILFEAGEGKGHATTVVLMKSVMEFQVLSGAYKRQFTAYRIQNLSYYRTCK